MSKYSKIETLKLILSLIAFWFVGVIIALFAGLGWFFLIETLRRILFLVPKLNTAVINFILGRDTRKVPEDFKKAPCGFLCVAMRYAIICAWIILTILVFCKANIRIIEVLFK
jgi:hypothetical protein